MAGKHTLFRNLKSIMGVAFIGLGGLILAGNLVAATVQLSHLLGISADLAEKLGPLGTTSVAISQAFWAYLFDHQEFSRGVHQILILFWPVLLVIAGGAVVRDRLTGKASNPQKNTPVMSISPLPVRR
jgi:hypothetical protein